jgi:hypothetical protein
LIAFDWRAGRVIGTIQTVRDSRGGIDPMAEILYFPEVECQATPSDLFETMIVGVPDETENHHFLRVARGVVRKEDGRTYLPVGIVEVDRRKKRALIQLPYEADSGANRLWVPFEKFRQRIATPEESESFA